MATPQNAPSSRPATAPLVSEEPLDFSLVLGGPTYQFFRRSHLSGSGLELLYRRVIIIPLLAWLPLLLVTLFESSGARTSFFRDIELHSRFLVALPVLIFAEVIVHLRIRPAVRSFVDRNIVLSHDLPRFHRAIDSATKLRNSIPLEIALLVLVYTVGLYIWNVRPAPIVQTWYLVSGDRWQLTPAGYWYVFVSIPIFQFILLRWYLRMFIWFRFLWQVRRLDLNLIPTHPDRCAGLAFIGRSSYAFGPIVFAQGCILAGVIATRVMYVGENLLSFKLTALGFVAFFVAAILFPLLMFTPKLAAAKRTGLREYGVLAQHYVEEFDHKWLRGGSTEELLGSGDIQSLADLGNSYQVIREMRPVPFGMQDITRIGAAAAVPLVPLLLTIFSPEELILRILKMAF